MPPCSSRRFCRTLSAVSQTTRFDSSSRSSSREWCTKSQHRLNPGRYSARHSAQNMTRIAQRRRFQLSVLGERAVGAAGLLLSSTTWIRLASASSSRSQFFRSALSLDTFSCHSPHATRHCLKTASAPAPRRPQSAATPYTSPPAAPALSPSCPSAWRSVQGRSPRLSLDNDYS